MKERPQHEQAATEVFSKSLASCQLDICLSCSLLPRSGIVAIHTRAKNVSTKTYWFYSYKEWSARQSLRVDPAEVCKDVVASGVGQVV